MADRLSGVAVIICIAFGIMTFILLFIFAKRQITRFTIKSRHSPHAPIGHDAPKKISQEIDRQLDIINQIQYKPKLFHGDTSHIEDNKLGNHLHRVLVLDIFSLFENKLTSTYSAKRLPSQDLRSYLLCLAQSGPLVGCDHHLIHKFIDIYEHARYEPKEFRYEQYQLFIEMLEYLYKCINQHIETAEISNNKLQLLGSSRHLSDVKDQASKKSALVLQPSSRTVKTSKLLHETTV